MNNKIIIGLLVMFFIMVYSSCTKDDNKPSNPNVTDTIGGGTHHVSIMIPTRFPDRHIKQIIQKRLYDSTIVSSISFTWNGSVVSRIDGTFGSYGGDRRSCSFEYEGGHISRSIVTRIDTYGDSHEDTYEYVYDTDGHLIEQIKNSGEDRIVYEYLSKDTIIIRNVHNSTWGEREEDTYILTWNNNNITNVEHLYDGQYLSTISYSYDKKNNPLYMPVGPEVENLISYFFPTFSGYLWWCENNEIHVSVSSTSDNVNGYNANWQYSYDIRNYPTRWASMTHETIITYHN